MWAVTGTGQAKGLTPIPEKTTTQGITRAVVVGISDYQNKNITDLQFAHEDAMAFAAYLTDPKGMNVDSQNVTLLINEEATAGRFISALYGLMESAREGDQTIIYFSGHGDVESTTINQPGFLLCWDAPSRVYMAGGTFGLAYLQEIIATLSLSGKNKVVVIADACRAGKLAGSSIGGSNATAANLAKQFANEVKIMSCQPDELSLEGRSWGNGRGVFSYYFLAGLKGMADKNNDRMVTLGEIERYLDDEVPNAVAPHSQIPLTSGNKNTPLAAYDPDELTKFRSKFLNTTLSGTGLKGVVAGLSLADTSLQEKILAFERALGSGQLTSPPEVCAWDLLKDIEGHPLARKYTGILKRNLAAALQDDAQQAINAYLVADKEELKERWSFGHKYEKYPDHLLKATQLVGEQHFFYNSLMSRYHYFKGLNLRLKGEQEKNDSLLLQSLEDQMLSLQFLKNSPHVLNEIGWTYHLLNNHETSVDYLTRASTQAPEWPMPQINLSLRYRKVKEHDKSLAAALRAVSMDSLFTLSYETVANCYLEKGDHQQARLYLRKILLLDSLNSKAMNIMGYSLNQTGQYEESAVWYQKMIDSDPSAVTTVNLNSLAYVLVRSGQKEKALEVCQRSKSILPLTELSFQGIIEYYYYTGDMANAEKELREYVVKFSNDNFAYYLLASICGADNREEECFKYLDLAFANGFNDLDVIHSDKNLAQIISNNTYYDLLKKYGLPTERK